MRLVSAEDSFYKYKDDIFPFHDSTQGKTVTLSMQIEDEPGLLSDVLQVIAQFGANILTIHQSIPINGVAALSISVQAFRRRRTFRKCWMRWKNGQACTA